jgi:hypothetical protein
MSMTKFKIDPAEAELVAKASEKHRTVAEPHADATQVESEADLDMIQACGYSHCPHCGVNLDNGLMDFDSLADVKGGEKEAFKLQKQEWACMGCNGEWGLAITPKGSKARGAPLRHYVNKSTVDGAVALSHSIYEANPDARRKDAIQLAVDAGVAFYTARTQYQKWFKRRNATRAK